MSKALSQGRLFQVLGGFILLASCLFLFWQAKDVWQHLANLSIPVAFVRVTAIASVAYAGMLSLLALAWAGMLQNLAPANAPSYGECWRVFMRTQVPKYLPGNIFHYLGRVELLSRAGLPRTTVMLSLLYEGFLLMAVATLLGAFGWWQTSVAKDGAMEHFPLIALGCIAVLTLLWIFQHRRARALGGVGAPGRSWMVASVYYALFFLMMAGVLWTLALFAGQALPFSLCLTATAVPWLLGFATPGAPGGIGVREATMLMLLKSALSPEDGLLLVMAMRLVTLLGDVWALPLSYIVRPCHAGESSE